MMPSGVEIVGFDSKHIHFGTVDALSARSSPTLRDAFELQFALLFVADDCERDRRSGRTHLAAEFLRRDAPRRPLATRTDL